MLLIWTSTSGASPNGRPTLLRNRRHRTWHGVGMRFTLTYRGPLTTKGNARQKHELRRSLHPQLKELWTHRPLEQFSPRWLNPTDGGDEGGRALRRTAGRDFAVVVGSDQRLLVELNLLMLRPEHPGSILQHADIDNRLKTLFDALRHPGKKQELPDGWAPSADETPLHCLLDDDRLISRVNVDTDRLLNPASPTEVALTIRVRVRASSPTWNSASLIS